MSKDTQLDAILIHGMGRTPLAMSLLAARLQAAGIRPHLFGYSVTFERWEGCVRRLERFIQKRIHEQAYIMIGHSFGTVLTRAILPRLAHPPAACFLLAPPTRACRAARHFAPRRFARILGGEIVQLLADPQFMASLPLTTVPTKIYAGTGGPRGRYSPFGQEVNDGILSVQETILPGVPMQMVPTLHTFLPNSKLVTRDIVQIAKSPSSLHAQ